MSGGVGGVRSVTLTGPYPDWDASSMRLRLASFNRFQAALIHLALSALIATTAFTLIYALWFPGALFEAAGGRKLFFLIAGVDVTMGPLLTLVVFDTRKKSLRFDLAVIAILQLAALCYGGWVLFQARPAFIVFVKDRFELVRANDIPKENFASARDERYARAPLAGPRIVGVRLPKDPDEIFKLIMSAMNGMDVQAYPKYYVPYAQVRSEVTTHGQPIAKLRELNPGRGAQIDRLVAATGRKPGDVRFLPMRAGKVDLSVLIDARDGKVLRIVSLRPWKYT